MAGQRTRRSSPRSWSPSWQTFARTRACRRDFAALLRGADARDWLQASEALSGFDKPALVVWAADDKFFPREHGRRLAELLPQGRFSSSSARARSSPRTIPSRSWSLCEGLLEERPLGDLRLLRDPRRLECRAPRRAGPPVRAAARRTGCSSATTRSSRASRASSRARATARSWRWGCAELAAEAGTALPAEERDALAARYRAGRSSPRSAALARHSDRGWKLVALVQQRPRPDRGLPGGDRRPVRGRDRGLGDRLLQSGARPLARRSTSRAAPTRPRTCTWRRATSTTSRRRSELGIPSIWINRLGEAGDPRRRASSRT